MYIHSIVPGDTSMYHHSLKSKPPCFRRFFVSLGVLSPAAASDGVPAPTAGQRRQCHRSVRPRAVAARPAGLRDGDLVIITIVKHT